MHWTDGPGISVDDRDGRSFDGDTAHTSMFRWEEDGDDFSRARGGRESITFEGQAEARPTDQPSRVKRESEKRSTFPLTRSFRDRKKESEVHLLERSGLDLSVSPLERFVY